MNKKQLAECIFSKLEVKRFEAYGFIDLLIDVIGEELARGGKIVLSNFGTFRILQRQEKRVINPNNKSEMRIPAQKIVKFLPSKNLKEIVREK